MLDIAGIGYDASMTLCSWGGDWGARMSTDKDNEKKSSVDIRVHPGCMGGCCITTKKEI